MIFITGLSRSGTSLLLLFFALNGINTGYEKEVEQYRRKLTEEDDDNKYALRGGMDFFSDNRKKLRRGKLKEFPRVIKQTWAPTERSPKRKLVRHGLEPSRIIITKRDPEAVARSNLALSRHKKGHEVSYKAMLDLVEKRYSILEKDFPDAVWIEFPRFVTDFDYLWLIVGPWIIPEVSYKSAKRKFSAVADSKFVRYN